jgi:hypothetical protein
MDQKAKDAQLDAKQWKAIVKKTLCDKREVFDKIKRVVFLHTIEPYKMYLRLEHENGYTQIWEATGLSENGKKEFAKCAVLAETVFKR